MFCLVYRSTASPAFGKAQIQGMLEKARTNNQGNTITGCLLYYKGEFLQYLEGNQVKVLQLFDKIISDSRHHTIELISHDHIETRQFKKWEMAYEDFLGDNDALQFLKLLVSSYFDGSEKPMDPNPTSKYFWRTAKRLLMANTSGKYRR
ncbi:MAG: BLUF domain-containing protein [Bacteroidota bacterium]